MIIAIPLSISKLAGVMLTWSKHGWSSAVIWCGMWGEEENNRLVEGLQLWSQPDSSGKGPAFVFRGCCFTRADNQRWTVTANHESRGICTTWSFCEEADSLWGPGEPDMGLGSVRGRSALRDPICYSLLLCAVSQGLYSLSVPGKLEWAELHAVLRTEIMRKGTCLDSFQWLPSVTFYWEVIYSVMPLFLRIWNAFWPFQDCYLLGFVFAQVFYCLKLPCIKIHKHAFLQIKHPCFTRDLGHLYPSSCWFQSPGPGLQRPWQCTNF